MQGVLVNEQELTAVLSHYNLTSRKDWLKGAMRSIWDRDQAIVFEDSDLYDYVKRSGMGVRVEVRRPR